MTGLLVLGVALALAAALAAVHRRRDGRLRRTRAVRRATGGGTALDVPEGSEDLRPLLPAAAGERATLLQFSSAFCAPCRATRRTLAEIAALVPGVEHVEVDAESALDLVRRLNVLKTPTTLLLGADGREVLRASGQPRKAEVLGALEQALPS